MDKWNSKFNHKLLGEYVYGLAVPAFGTTFIVKYVGQASVSDRCFAHSKEAEFIKNNPDITPSNKEKIDLLNYQNKRGNVKIIILAHKVPDEYLNTMENIYRWLAEKGTLLFDIQNERIISSDNLTNIAATHNDSSLKMMVVKPYTTDELDALYTIKSCLEANQIKSDLSTNSEILFIRDREGIKHFSGGDFLGCWYINEKHFNKTEWIVICDPHSSDKICHVYRSKDIILHSVTNNDLSEQAFVQEDLDRKCLLIDNVKDYCLEFFNNHYFDCPKWTDRGVNYL